MSATQQLIARMGQHVDALLNDFGWLYCLARQDRDPDKVIAITQARDRIVELLQATHSTTSDAAGAAIQHMLADLDAHWEALSRIQFGTLNQPLTLSKSTSTQTGDSNGRC